MSPYPFLLIVEQGKHERLLYEFIKSHDKDVLWQTKLTDFSQDAAGVTATIINANGEQQMIQAQYLAGCDGAKSFVRAHLGLSFEGSTLERLFYVADVQIKWEFPHDMLTACLAKDRSTAFFPMPGEDHYRIVGVFPEDSDKKEGEILYEEIERQILEDTELQLDIYKVNWFSTYKVHSRHVNKFSEGRCFVAGDAAHIHTPAGGQGMNTGIQDVFNLAWKLSFVLKGYASDTILDSYNEERLPNAKRLLEATARMFNLAAGSDWLLRTIRTTIFPPLAGYIVSLDAVKKRFFPLISQIGISYRTGELSEHDGDEKFDIKAGDRLPYCLVDGASLYDRLHEPKFHLLTFSDGEHDYHEIAEAIAGEYSDFLDHHLVPLYPHLVELFG